MKTLKTLISSTMVVVILSGALSTSAEAIPFRRADHNDSGITDITDAIEILKFVNFGTSPPVCDDGTDVDNSGIIDLFDAIFLLEYLFIGSYTNPAPGPSSCGSDTGTSLGCGSYTSC